MRLREAGRRTLARWRRLAVFGGLALTGICAPAQAGTFRVSQCAAWDGASWTARGVQATLWSASGGWIDAGCSKPGGSLALITPNHRLAYSEGAAMTLTLPAALGHTAIHDVWLNWVDPAQAPSTDPSWADVFAGATRVLEVPAGAGTSPNGVDHLPTPSGTRKLTFQQWCSPRDGPGWCNWDGPELAIRGVSLDLDEAVAPELHAAGSLLDGTPQRGDASVTVQASDDDSGVRRIDVRLGAADLGTIDLAGACADDRLPVCPSTVARTLPVDTARLPEGSARLRLHAVDAAGNTVDLDAGRVEIDNTPDPPPAPPPVGQAPSGSGGASAARPVGDPFPPNPLAGAGHVGNGRRASERARLTAQLVDGTRTGRAMTVGAQARPRVRGRLLLPDGTPVGGALLTVVERVADGRRRTAGVLRTRGDGHFGGPLRSGPSREVAVVYRAFGDSPAAHWSRWLRLAVRARVRLQAMRAGDHDLLQGRVAGPVPRSGVLVAVEHRVAGRWLVAARVHSDGRGRFHRRLPARRQTVRATVPEQAGYPYATGSSRTLELR